MEPNMGLDRLSTVVRKASMSRWTYTTQEAADAVGITRATLQDWIKKRKFAAPKLRRLGNVGGEALDGIGRLLA
jgi:excisionase family DNA binding protein